MFVEAPVVGFRDVPRVVLCGLTANVTSSVEVSFTNSAQMAVSLDINGFAA